MNKVPRYRGLRILIVPVILYYMLISPVLGILYISYSPKLLKRDVTDFLKRNPTDSIIKEAENLKIAKDSIKVIDSLIHEAEELANDTIINKSKGLKFDLSQTDNKGYFGEGEKLFFNWLIIAFVLAFLFSLPFKVYFRRKRKKKKIPLFIESYCRKSILYSPLIIAAIIAIPFLIQNANLIDQLFFSEVFKEEFRKEMFLKYWSIFLLSSLLTVAFVYTWQKHNMQLKYLQHIYTPIELRKRIFKFRRGKVKYRLVFSSFLTTLLPLSIVVAYILMSVTSLSELNLYEPTQGEYKVIFGEYAKMFSDVDLYEFVKNTNPHYINVVDTILMFFGIGAGIFVTIIYLIFFVSWTNSDVINPVKELLRNMQKTTGGQLENYSLVRTNDELGELSENYNVMTSKLHEYVSHIDKMNAELEQKVKERTAEIQAQKEEIEAQRDEVESQRDEIERQRDYVIEQRDLIILQKKAITDSIEYAGNIQSAILPPSDYLKSTLKEHFIFFKPRDIVSGDFYWAHQIKSSKGNKSIIVAADSTGHGVPGAFMSMLGVTLLNEIIVKKGITNPSHILDNLKDNVVNSLHQTNEIGKSKDGIDIAVCKIDYQNLKLEYAGAYNPVYILRTINNKSEQEKQKQFYEKKGYIVEMYNEKVLIELKADKNPIGISNKARNPYTLNELDLKKGDILYMFSDGYADQFGGTRRLKFLYSRFKDLLQRNSDQSMEMQKDELNKAFNTWKGHNRQVDDILVMGIKIN
ncbi:MAG: SpoIIE family protein phosphatase [Bacteroidales bacterium]|nr:SpoIIE family protein phosphatase [Bacteroidales bacterium]